MNVILLLDSANIWKMDAGGVSVAQRHIDAVMGCRGVQRLAVSATREWTGENAFFKVPVFSMPGMKLRSWIRYASESAETQVYDVMREMGWDSAVIIGSHTPFLFTFMLDEIFDGLPNKEYGLRIVRWQDVVRGNFLEGIKGSLSDIKISEDIIDYCYSEVIRGAAWEEITEEINGEQKSIPI